MATLKGLNVYPTGANAHWQQRNFFSFRTTSGASSYVHMKTNIPENSYEMWMIEAVGYAYGSSGRPIRNAWVFYCYPPAGGTSYIGLHQASTGQGTYDGGTADGAYDSSDGFVTLRYSGGMYYTGFILNAYPTRYGQRKVQITEYAQNSTSGAHY